jgi:hypothetical protein
MSTITSTSPGHNVPDFTELAEKLQATAQALLAISSTAEEEGREPTPPEIRSYSISGAAVKEERQLLKLLKAEDWQHMFGKIYDQLYTMALLMHHFEADEKINGFSIQQMGETLMVPLAMFNRLCSLVGDFDPVASEDDSEAE